MIIKKNTDYLSLALCMGILLAVVTYITLTLSGNTRLSFIEGDQLLYMQYGRNMAEGSPYIFTSGDSPSTGSTSHLYPWILAGLYTLGFHNNLFFIAIFIINALFFLGIITCVWLIALKIAPKIAPTATFMTLISGQTLGVAFGQTDMGLFTFITLAATASLLYSRYYWTAFFIILCSLSRPEGFIFSISFLLIGLISITIKTHPSLKASDQCNEKANKRSYMPLLIIGLCGLITFGLILLLNYSLTGYTQFMSVMNKGYFKVYPLAGAIQYSLFNLAEMVKGVLFAIPVSSRQFFSFPILGGILCICGILLNPRKQKQLGFIEGWFLLCAGGSILCIATSQWQGVSNDRYLGWIYPIITIYTLIGVQQLSIYSRNKYLKPILISLLFGYQTLSMLLFFSFSYTSGTFWETKRTFIEEVNNSLPKNSQIGSLTGGGSSQFFSPNLKIRNLSGITCPQFFTPRFDNQPFTILEIIKHNPESKFDYWLMRSSAYNFHEWAHPFIGNIIKKDTDSTLTSGNSDIFYTATWNSLDNGNTPVLLQAKLKKKSLISQLDIGYQPDEKAHNYKTYSRLSNTKIPVIYLNAILNKKTYSEVGRLILGSESFTIHNLTPHKPLYIALRTAQQTKVNTFSGNIHSSIKKYKLKDQTKINLFIDDIPIPCLPIKYPHSGFNESLFEIPADYINHQSKTITISGDHISFSYWFYQ